jgi:hypothetical protein
MLRDNDVKFVEIDGDLMSADIIVNDIMKLIEQKGN